LGAFDKFGTRQHHNHTGNLDPQEFEQLMSGRSFEEMEKIYQQMQADRKFKFM
jgi:hypothetical protein